MRRILFLLALIVLYWPAFAYDFTAVSPSGHALYYYTIFNGGETQAKVAYNPYVYYLYQGNLIIPDSVTYNGSNIPVTVIDEYAFSNCHNITSVYVGASIVGNFAFTGCDSLETVVLGSNVNTIGHYVFQGCHSLSSIVVSDNLSFIGDEAFDNCYSLTSIVIPDGVVYIGNSAFMNCSSLTSVVIPNSIDSIAASTFEGCTNLNNVVIGNGVMTIGYHAFAYCTNLKTVDIGSGVTSIENAFSGCDSLSFMYIRSSSLPPVHEPIYVSECDDYSVWPNCSPCNINCFVQFYVPCNAIHFYQETSPWDQYYSHSRIHPILNYSYVFESNDESMGTVEVAYESCPQTVAVNAIAKPGFQFVRWSDGYTNSGREIWLSRDTMITALFDTISYAIVGWSNNSNQGTVTGSDTVYIGHTVTLTAIPNYGYHFWQWSDGSTENPRTIVAIEDKTLCAYFEEGSDHFFVSAVSMDTTRGTVLGGGMHDYLSECTISALPNDGYHFSMWSDGDTNNPRSFTLTQDTVFTAIFEINNHQLIVLPNNSTLGYVFGSGIYPYGTQVTIAASPTLGNRFDHWSDNSTLPIRSFPITGDLQLTAIFMAADTLVVHDTTYIDVHDTSYISVSVHDTTVVTDTVTLTEYVQVHDTTVVTDTVTLTEYVPVHDTTYISVPVHDTTYIMQTDTVMVTEYVPVHDTTYITQIDTVIMTQNDTIINTIFDTLTVTDTLWLTQTDTLWMHDTIIIHDTTYITQEGIDGVDALNAKVYSSQGQIVVEGADGNTVWLYDINGRVLATKQDDYTPLRFDAPVSGTYIIKIGLFPARKVVVIR